MQKPNRTLLILNTDNTITVKCNDGKFRTFNLGEIVLDDYIKTGEVEKSLTAFVHTPKEINLPGTE